MTGWRYQAAAERASARAMIRVDKPIARCAALD